MWEIKRNFIFVTLSKLQKMKCTLCVFYTSTLSDPFPDAFAMKFIICLAETVLPAPLSPLNNKQGQFTTGQFT